MRFPTLELSVPAWLEECCPPAGTAYPTPEERMELALAFARANVSQGGGPFAAAVFERRSGRFVTPGVNLVLSAQCSVLHAEIVALALAQQLKGSYDLGGPDQEDHELVSTAEPCAMCLGALPWSGVRGLVCGARDADARAAGFDEGEKPPAWDDALRGRGIAVLRDVRREEAAALIRDYVRGGGPIYNGRGAGPSLRATASSRCPP